MPSPAEAPGGGAAGPPGPRRRPLMMALSLALTACLVGAIAWFVHGHIGEFRELWAKPIPKSILALMPVAWLLMIVSNSELLRWPMTAFGLRLSFLEGLALTAATTAVNYLIPLKSGSGLRGLYIAAGRGLAVTDYVAQLVSVTTMTLSTASLFAFGGLAAIWAQGRSPSPVLMAYFGGTFLLGLASVLFLGRLPFRLPKRLRALAQGWDGLRSATGLMARLAFLQIVYFLSWALCNWLSLAAFGVRLSLAEVFFFCGGQIHTTIVNLTPAGLGVVEAFSVYASDVMEFTPAQALSAQALNRLTAVSMLAFLGLWGWLYLSALMRRRKTAPQGPRP
ncbi:MAG: flippase-like domain-containing protein [Deltaproteobacteria bacterium]|nr:flippase-like domain-containing protein [Deltaproteobacteria bacterium]